MNSSSFASNPSNRPGPRLTGPRLLLIIAMIFAWPALSTAADSGAVDPDALDRYVQRLRTDLAGPRSETGFMSAGSDFLYGQDYFEAGNYSSAAGYFRSALRTDERNAFVHYQLGISLRRSGDSGAKELAQTHLDTALRLEPQLRHRLSRDFPATPVVNAPVAKEAAPPAPDPVTPAVDSLSAYIQRLKQSRAVRGPETEMNSPGQSALYGIEHYEQNEFDSAATNFRLALARDAANPHLNYLLAVSLAAVGNEATAVTHRDRAVAGDPTLAANYARDVAAAKQTWTAIIAAKQPKTNPRAQEPPPGGVLVFGEYVCSESVWNGPGANPQFRSAYRGYLELKANGTYRWLDDGATGRYRYDTQTGRIEWLSGHLATTAPVTIFRRSGSSGLMALEFDETNRWSAICEKK